MEKRHSDRATCHLKVKIVSADITYDGFIENVSEEGFECMIPSFIQAPEDFALDNMIKLEFLGPSGETINLNCVAIWHLRSSLDYKKMLMGMKIIEPSQDYNDLMRKGKYWYL